MAYTSDDPIIAKQLESAGADASYDMELGADGILANTAIAQAQKQWLWQKPLNTRQ